MKPPVTNPEILSKQLSKPQGKLAQAIGEYMFFSNKNMIFKTIDCIKFFENNEILEVGFGNGQHLEYLFSKCENVHYTGIDVSEEMVKMAKQKNAHLKTKADFIHYAPNQKIDLNKKFDSCFMVNVIYFIENLKDYFKNIFNLLQPNGQLILGVIDKKFAEKLSFTQNGFRLYEQEEMQSLLMDVGFKKVTFQKFKEKIQAKDGTWVQRTFWIVITEK